jgi:hypothetical protein
VLDAKCRSAEPHESVIFYFIFWFCFHLLDCEFVEGEIPEGVKRQDYTGDLSRHTADDILSHRVVGYFSIVYAAYCKTTSDQRVVGQFL